MGQDGLIVMANIQEAPALANSYDRRVEKMTSITPGNAGFSFSLCWYAAKVSGGGISLMEMNVKAAISQKYNIGIVISGLISRQKLLSGSAKFWALPGNLSWKTTEDIKPISL